ncbi:hypothetical protein N1851_012375 [Merluccius polli]|uniref:Endonuclease/exonuclease/phosphatase domain-containing protein n=1 Tax=Merluccius polli TaxID=89951 RepID=A0AA47MWN1_MERPO|nr:hypothetical protein N1851_012375 [Merluccius polli]
MIAHAPQVCSPTQPESSQSDSGQGELVLRWLSSAAAGGSSAVLGSPSVSHPCQRSPTLGQCGRRNGRDPAAKRLPELIAANLVNECARGVPRAAVAPDTRQFLMEPRPAHVKPNRADRAGHKNTTGSAFEFHTVAVTLSIKLYIAVIYRPPGPFCDFFDEMDALLSCFPEDGTPLVVLGDINIQPEKLHSSDLTNFFTTFDLTLSPLPSYPQGWEPTRPCLHKVLLYLSPLCYPPPRSSTSLPPAPHIVNSRLRPHAPARTLRATTLACRLVPPSLRAGKGCTAKSQLFSVLAPHWWNHLPADVRTAESITCFRVPLDPT